MHWLKNDDGTLSYYQSNGILDQSTGYYLGNGFGQFIYIDKNAYAHKGVLKFGNTTQYFDANGYQLKNKIVNVNGKKQYFAARLGNLVKNSFFSYKNNYYYADKNGNAVTRAKTINKKKYYLNSNGQQVKGSYVVNKKTGH